MRTYNQIKMTLNQLGQTINSCVPSNGAAKAPVDTVMINMELFVQARKDIGELANLKDISRNASFFKADSAITAEQASELKTQYADILKTYSNSMGISGNVVAHIYDQAVPGSHYSDMVSRHSHTSAMAA